MQHVIKEELGLCPINSFLAEHRLIERVIPVIEGEVRCIQAEHHLHFPVLDDLLEFLRSYVQDYHQQREEIILFELLSKKQLATDHRTKLQEFIDSHIYERQLFENLLAAKKAYDEGAPDVLEELCKGFQALIEFYPLHLHNEDRYFWLFGKTYLSHFDNMAILRKFYQAEISSVYTLDIIPRIALYI
jgi:hemerythrin-like domain-containing protein